MAELGFIIPLNLNDYLAFIGKPQGDRTNWCSTQQWWTNENIQLSGSSLGPTSAKVGDTVSVQVGIQGVLGSHGTEEGQILHVQAWVCYPNTVPGGAGPLVPSMLTGPTPAKDLTGSPVSIFGSAQVGDYQSPGPAYKQFTLDNTWSPQQQDIIPPNTDAHCCILATCQGLADINNEGGVEVGLFVLGTDLSPIDICTEPHEGQTNVTILPISGGMRRGGLLLSDFGFLSGAAVRGERAQVVVEVTPLAQPNGIDPAVLRVLKAGPWSGLPLRPATSDPRGLGLRKNRHGFEGWLAKIVCEAEEFIEDLVEIVEGRPDDDHRGRRIRLTLPPNGLQPLLMQTELDASEPPGTVHVFDIVQTETSGRRGGIRVGVVVVP
ncbi:MAG TPA: hypothetical protein VKI44_20130 [Acetobacteraceae bacterium]|nr:hypothetical protein [Acetobacteraceae bacterium]